MRAEILTIGDELCRGEIVDSNSSYLAGRLWDLDITTRWMTSCCDDDADIAAAVETAVTRADVVVCSGGLGPTEDDLTVDVVARLAGAEVVVDEPARARMEARFALGKIPLTPIQLRQVRVPTGARVYANSAGLAPGFEAAVRGVPVVCVPGVPRELYALWDDHLAARLGELREARGDREHVARRIYRCFGRGESQISQACRGLVDGVAGATIHYQVKFPETLVKLVVRDRDAAAAAGRLAALDAGLRERLGTTLYGDGDDDLVVRVTRRIVETKTTLATAESCTGGMLGELVTRRPGVSAAYVGGAICYSNAEKVRQLGVAQATLDTYGAVSEPCAREMAEGARGRLGSQLAVAITGIAGPDGGTPDKPVGTVWIALASSSGTRTKLLNWPGARDQIRLLASWWALKLVGESLDA